MRFVSGLLSSLRRSSSFESCETRFHRNSSCSFVPFKNVFKDQLPEPQRAPSCQSTDKLVASITQGISFVASLGEEHSENSNTEQKTAQHKSSGAFRSGLDVRISQFLIRSSFFRAVWNPAQTDTPKFLDISLTRSFFTALLDTPRAHFSSDRQASR